MESTNTLPLFYWWDETNQLWHASGISNKSYPYTGNVGNFSVAPDGSLWGTRWPARGDIVTFRSPKDGTLLIKRLVALPGDTGSVQQRLGRAPRCCA